MHSKLNELVLAKLREATAMMLWESGAVKINLEQPFKLASGNFSPIYINCRQVISNPTFMSLYVATARMILEQNQVRIDMAAGGETAGIPFSAYIAMELSKPMLYVRKARKGYGIANLVEGGNPSGSKVLLVEDLITDAGNKLHFIEAIREAGGIVEDVLVLFDRLQGGAETLLEHGVKLHAVSNMNSALEAAYVSGICLKTDLDSVRKYLDDQKSWHVERGLEFLE